MVPVLVPPAPPAPPVVVSSSQSSSSSEAVVGVDPDPLVFVVTVLSPDPPVVV